MKAPFEVLSVGRVGFEPTHSRVEDFKFLGFVSIPYNCVYGVYKFYIWGVKVSIVSILSIKSMLIAH